ncbi:MULTISPECIES: helix-turn-helix transcriptional regulator [Bacillus]|uniref:Transcriptional regulator n=3 Tax=Bacillus thuringiensis TaxID=1428 RepID=A0A1W6WR81_BACTU|nr:MULTISPECIES: helix-turn-helix domain-containing protein [Bacillus]AEA17457.1 PbsX family transcriptional regulator [Bacillus thuringiensis serovar chinensis CT-43]AFV19602.1 PbsX family transcriptional regulator [Bacillus thuringiensis Bt407]AGG02565.1 Transcriptional regulator, pbsX family [Bacillus thuringiensis serovar thuringiensis str. IS5056]ARP59105.1 transcriptional regulator [Bacillus thuringiensis]EEM27479.1 Transcriptional regulator, pbsX [Bacillus thuringiensis Bt407]
MNKKRNKMIEFRNNQSRLVVARNLKITPQMLGAIERGDRTPSLELAKRIADFYKTTIDDLFFS